MSTPFLRRWVANECLRMWGVTFFLIPALSAYFFIIIWTYLELSLLSCLFVKRYSLSLSLKSRYSISRSLVFSSKRTILSFSPLPLTRIVRSSKSMSLLINPVSSEIRNPVEYKRARMTLSLIFDLFLLGVSSASQSTALIKSCTSFSFNDLGSDLVLFGFLISSRKCMS